MASALGKKPPNEPSRSKLFRRLLIPCAFVVLLVIVVARSGQAPVTEEPPLPPSATTPAPIVRSHTNVPERSISRNGPACQEWKIGAPPKAVKCPSTLADGEVLTYERDATCMRRGGSTPDSPVPCPMAVELALPPGEAPPAPPTPPAVPDRPRSP